MFVIELLTSDVDFKQVPRMVEKFMLFHGTHICHHVLRQRSPKYSALYPSLIIAIAFLHWPIFQLDIWPHRSPNFGCFGHSPLLRIHLPV